MAQCQTDIEKYLKAAVEEAAKSVTESNGRPFGAVIVKDGEIVARGRSIQLKLMDPTAHAEITAIREASAKLGTLNLKGCILYSSSYPCPMCFGGCLWAGLDKVYYACSLDQAADAGFKDSQFYAIIRDDEKRQQFAIGAAIENAQYPMQLWNEKGKGDGHPDYV